MPRVYIAVGSNLGNRLQTLEGARKSLRKRQGLWILRVSSYHETEPVGGPPQGKYLNGVWEIETDLNAEMLLKELLAVEVEFGRTRGEKNAPRTLDLDILLYENQIIHSSGLEIPHPKMQERLFVLAPLCELAPELKHPVIKKSMRELKESLSESNS